MTATPPTTITLPLAALADAIGSTAERLAPLLEIAAEKGAVRLDASPEGPAVTLDAAAARRLALRRDGGRWMAGRPEGPAPGPGEPRPEHVPRDFAAWPAADPRALPHWEELEPPTDRIASLCRWLSEWSGVPPRGIAQQSSAGPAPPRRAGGPAPRRNAFCLVALRARLEAARTS